MPLSLPTTILLSTLLPLFLPTTITTTTSQRKPIIIDTDIQTDCDDVGALAIANIAHNCGLADLKCVVINTHSKYGALTASAVNTYFGNGDEVPVGALRELTGETFFDGWGFSLGEFASKVAYHFPRTLNETENTPTPLELYRSILAEAANASLTIISIGFLTNLADLLNSEPDEISSLTGSELVAAKVRELVIMGGQYPSGWEFNFGGYDVPSARTVLETWPSNVPMTFSGLELGRDIFSGQGLKEHAPQNSPILAAYEWYVGRCGTMRESWDPVTVLYGILGLDGDVGLGLESPFEFANVDGYNRIVGEKGENEWVFDEGVRNQHWLKLKDGVGNESVSEMLNRFLAHDPKVGGCGQYKSEL